MSWHLHKFGFPAIWKRTRGAGARVAVLDSGLEESTLAPARVGSYSLDGKPTVGRDRAGHGTSIAGLIVRHPRNPLGVAPEAEILSLSVYHLGAPRPTQTARAIRAALDLRADIINCSFRLDEVTSELRDAVAVANAAGVPIVCAAGNNSSHRAFPEDLTGLFTVGACTKFLAPVASTRQGPWIDVFAPGNGIRVVTRTGSSGVWNRSTSAAAAIVSGTLALGRSLRATTPGNELTHALIRTATRRSFGRLFDPVRFIQAL